MDWTQIIITAIITMPATLAAIFAGWASLRNKRQIVESAHDIKQTAINTAEDVKKETAKTVSEVKETALKAAESSKASLAANTKLTAKTADQVDRVASSLNGALDAKIKNAVDAAVGPIKESIEVHQDQDEKNMAEIRNVLADLVKTTKGKIDHY